MARRRPQSLQRLTMAAQGAPEYRGHMGRGFATLCVALATACSGPATLRLQDGRQVTGTIERSGVETIWVQSEDGQEVEVNRGDVVDVSHPGTAQMLLGGGLVALGGYVLATVPEDEPGHLEGDGRDPGNFQERASQYAIGAGLVAIGAGFAIAGAVARSRSTSRYDPTFTVGRRPPSPLVAARPEALH